MLLGFLYFRSLILIEKLVLGNHTDYRGTYQILELFETLFLFLLGFLKNLPVVFFSYSHHTCLPSLLARSPFQKKLIFAFTLLIIEVKKVINHVDRLHTRLVDGIDQFMVLVLVVNDTEIKLIIILIGFFIVRPILLFLLFF
jgi:uncharacterized membrane protein YhaH (DUF805 family)